MLIQVNDVVEAHGGRWVCVELDERGPLFVPERNKRRGPEHRVASQRLIGPRVVGKWNPLTRTYSDAYSDPCVCGHPERDHNHYDARNPFCHECDCRKFTHPPIPMVTPGRVTFGPGAALSIALSVAVPLRIAEYQKGGGPGDADRDRVREFAIVLGEKGDVLQYGGKPGEAADLFNRLADGLAVLSFQPGGVKAFGEHWQGYPDFEYKPANDSRPRG